METHTHELSERDRRDLAALADGRLTGRRAAALGQRPAVEPAPRPATAKLLDRQAAGLSFPDWSQKFGWRATGARTDTLAGRRMTTVFYVKGARRIAYTIVGGARSASATEATAWWRAPV